MQKRILSGVVGAAFVIFVLFFGQSYPAVLNMITAIIAALAINEIFSVMNISKIFIITIPTYIFTAFMPAFGYGISWHVVWYVYSLWIFSAMLLKPDLELKHITVTYAMALLISISFSCIINLRDFGGKYGNFFVLIALCIAWMSDTGAYFCGKLFGKNKLCPEISPKKTIEGFIGGILVCTVSTVALTFLLVLFIFNHHLHINYKLIIVMSIFGSMISALGDLCFSMIKRKCGVKDFGTLMPGHGGILDRFDSVIFVVPYVYIFLKMIPIVN